MHWAGSLYMLTLGCFFLLTPLAQGQERKSTGTVSFSGSITTPGCRSAWNAEHERVQTRECPDALDSKVSTPHVEAVNVFSRASLGVVHEYTAAGSEFALLDSEGNPVSTGSYRVTLHVP